MFLLKFQGALECLLIAPRNPFNPTEIWISL